MAEVAGWLTFDLDGTVLADPFGRLVVPVIDAHFAPALDGEPASEIIARRQRALYERGERLAVFDWDAHTRWLADATGLRWTADVAALADAVAAKLIPAQRQRFVFPDVRPALQSLRASGWRLAAVTNGFARYQVPLLRRLGLHDLFHAVIGPDTAGHVKPDARILDPLGPGARVRAHVGDLLAQDVCLAREAGALAIWLHRRRPVRAPTRRSLRRRLAIEGREVPVACTAEDAWPDAVIADLGEVVALVGSA